MQAGIVHGKVYIPVWSSGVVHGFERVVADGACVHHSDVVHEFANRYSRGEIDVVAEPANRIAVIFQRVVVIIRAVVDVKGIRPVRYLRGH